MPDRASARRVLVVDADPALTALIGEWLAEDGDADLVAATDCNDDTANARQLPPPALVVLDLPFRREAAIARIAEIKREFARTPIVALSSNLHAGVQCDGRVAMAFGVAAMLSKPLARAALVGAVQRLLATR
jgi:CheY-like chemotaxis protein